MIKLFRVDDRLVHGQVATKWVSRSNANKIYIVDDEVAANSVLVGISKQLAPRGTSVDVITVQRAIELLPKVEAHPQYRALIIVKVPRTILLLVEGGVKVDRLIVGGIQRNEMRQKFYRNIYASAQEREDMRYLMEKGVDVVCQATPDDAAVNVRTLL